MWIGEDGFYVANKQLEKILVVSEEVSLAWVVTAFKN